MFYWKPFLFWGSSGITVWNPVLDGDDQAVSGIEAREEEFIRQMEENFISFSAISTKSKSQP